MKTLKMWIKKPLDVSDHKNKEDRLFFRLMATSVLGILLCCVCFVGLSWAWFSVGREVTAVSIRSSTFTVSASVFDAEGQQISVSDGVCTLGQGVYNVTLTADGTASTGYCTVTVVADEYHTVQMEPGKTCSFTIDCTGAAGDAELTITPNWSVYSNGNEPLLGGDYTEIVLSSVTESRASDETEGDTWSESDNGMEQSPESDPDVVETEPDEAVESAESAESMEPTQPAESAQPDELTGSEQPVEVISDNTASENAETAKP